MKLGIILVLLAATLSACVVRAHPVRPYRRVRVYAGMPITPPPAAPVVAVG